MLADLVLFKFGLYRTLYPVSALAQLHEEIGIYADGVGLTCIDVQLAQGGGNLVADAEFDMTDDEGRPWTPRFSVPLGR